MDFPTAKDLQKISEDVSKNDGNEALYNEYVEDLKALLVDMARTKNNEIWVPYLNSGSRHGELILLSKHGYLDEHYTKKVFKMLADSGYEYHQYGASSIFSRKAWCKIWIED